MNAYILAELNADVRLNGPNYVVTWDDNLKQYNLRNTEDGQDLGYIFKGDHPNDVFLVGVYPDPDLIKGCEETDPETRHILADTDDPRAAMHVLVHNLGTATDNYYDGGECDCESCRRITI